jgi:hypothetical protein
MSRLTGILTHPRPEWALVSTEGTTASQLLTGYIAPLALLATAIAFVRTSIVGVSVPFMGTVRTPLLTGLTHAVLTFVMSMLGIGLLSVIINMLAPTFGAPRDSRRALQVAAYSMTAACVGSLFGLLPSMGTLLGFLAGCYGIYTLYLGLPVVMGSKPEKAGAYTAAVVICSIVAGILLGILSATVGIGSSAGLAALTGSNATAESAEVRRQEESASVGNAIGNMLGTDEKGKAGLGAAISNLAKAGEQMQKQDAAAANSATARASADDAAAGSAAAAGAAGAANATNGTNADAASATNAANETNAMSAAGGLLSALGGALGGPQRHTPVDFHKLEALLPASVPGMTRAGASGEAKQALGVQATSATAKYRGDGQIREEIRIADATGVSGLMDMAGSLATSETSESDSGYEKDVTVGGRSVHEKYDRNSHHGELSTLVAKRFQVELTGEGVAMEDLEKSLAAIDFGALEAMKNAGVQAAQ